MGPQTISQLRRLQQALIYHPIEDLIGVRCRIQSTASLPEEVLALARRSFDFDVTAVQPKREILNATVVTYGLMDLTYSLLSTSSPLTRPGVGIFRELGLVDGQVSDDELRGSDLFPSFLGDLTDEVGRDGLYLKVFLEVAEVCDGAERMRFGKQRQLPGYWPHEVIVVDACTTNADGIWLAKHFYL